MNFNRITVESDKLEDKPTIRGLPITVETVVRLVAASTNVHFYRLRELA
jgi:uncharacterized protein (DUF433 family)